MSATCWPPARGTRTPACEAYTPTVVVEVAEAVSVGRYDDHDTAACGLP